MPFWGIRVKPGNPYTHSNRIVTDRLRITQATLAIGNPTLRSSVFCKIGDNVPVLLCTLVPNTTESLQLNVEFEEAQDVIFSVIGPRPVYLTGYFVGHYQESNVQYESEPDGEDIANSDSLELNRGNNENDYDYEDSFINDDTVLSDRDDDDDEIDMSTNKQTVNGGYIRLKKSCRSDTNEEDKTEGKGDQPILYVPSSPEVVPGKKIKKEKKAAFLQKKGRQNLFRLSDKEVTRESLKS